jgi:hypothetical protein
MISPFEAAPLTPAVSAVYKSGVPVIELDRKTSGDNYTAFVGGDNRAIAKEAGEWAAKTLLPDGGEAAILEGLPSSSPAIERLEGFKAGIATQSQDQARRGAASGLDGRPGCDRLLRHAAIAPGHQAGVHQQRSCGGGRIYRGQAGWQDRPGEDHRHGWPAGTVRRHPCCRGRPMGSNVHLSRPEPHRHSNSPRRS